MQGQYYYYHKDQPHPIKHIREVPRFRKCLEHAHIEGANTRELASRYHRLIKRLANHVGRKGYTVCISNILPEELSFSPNVQLLVMKNHQICFEIWTNGHWFFHKDSLHSNRSVHLGSRVDVAIRRLLKRRLAKQHQHAKAMFTYIERLPEEWQPLAKELRPTCFRLSPQSDGTVVVTDILHDVGGFMATEYTAEEVTPEKLRQLQQAHDDVYHTNKADPCLDFLGVPSVG